MLTIIIRRLVLLVLVSQFVTVLGVPVNNVCRITLDDIDSNSTRFLYTRNSDNTIQRCTYCSAETRKSTNKFNEAKENQCVEKNAKIELAYNLVPNCMDMDPITCVIPFPIENGEWICSCSGIGRVKSGEVLVYTNCTQQCKAGYELVGDSFGHCGERVPHDKKFPTEFRYGNAQCSKREIADWGEEKTVITVITICGILISGLLVFLAVIVIYKCFCKKKTAACSHQGNGAAMVVISPLEDNSGSSVTEASEPATQTTSFTQVPRHPDPAASEHNAETSSLLTRKEDAEGLRTDFKSQDWKYTAAPEMSTSIPDSRNPHLTESPIQCDYPELPSMGLDLPSGGPITGLSTFLENSSGEDKLFNKDVKSCDVQLNNLSLSGSFWNGQCVLNRKDQDHKPLCYSMAIDILNSVYPEFNKQQVENELNNLCNKENPVMEVIFNLLKNYPCTIGDVVQWCVESEHPSVVPYLVSEEHENICMFCKNLKMKALHMENGDIFISKV